MNAFRQAINRVVAIKTRTGQTDQGLRVYVRRQLRRVADRPRPRVRGGRLLPLDQRLSEPQAVRRHEKRARRFGEERYQGPAPLAGFLSAMLGSSGWTQGKDGLWRRA